MRAVVLTAAALLAPWVALGGAACSSRGASDAGGAASGSGSAGAPVAAAALGKPAGPHGLAVAPPAGDPSAVVECPVVGAAARDARVDGEAPIGTEPPPATDDERLAALLEAANRAIVEAQFAMAWNCADRAADLAPSSVEAHHLRGAALAGLGRDAEAQIAYALALALDPDDPETLRAAADFYVNGKAARGRDSLRLGLELAQRGSRRVLARRRLAPALAADLALLEGQALNDLGRSDEALGRIDVALKHAPGRGDALHERGVALFDLSRFPEARATFARAIAIQPDDAYSHQLMGLTLEQLGDPAGAELALARARALAPGELAPPVLIDAAEIRREVDAVIEALPPDRRARVHAIDIQVADLPDPADLAAVKPPFPPTILGLYRGPVGRGHHHVADERMAIVLYRKNLARAVKTRAELSQQIRDTLLHEIGHLEGLDEDDLRRRGMD
jgi:Flp pilus assembly protein TadD/predicted Zn-dependent protease with MMP-like domain